MVYQLEELVRAQRRGSIMDHMSEVPVDSFLSEKVDNR